MLIIPAVDLLEGKVVRLLKGDMAKYTVYSGDPVDQAKKFIDMGVERLHIVDLDGARSGETINYDIIEKMASLDTLEIEVGGGIRDIKRIERYFNAGISYAIIGTAAVKEPDFTKAAMTRWPKQIILGIDARGGQVAVSGWYEDSGIKAVDLVKTFADCEAESVIYTDINKDGTLEGVNIQETIDMANNSPFPVIASGGVSSPADLEALRVCNHPNICGCIVGKAYYEGKIDIAKEIKLS